MIEALIHTAMICSTVVVCWFYMIHRCNEPNYWKFLSNEKSSTLAEREVECKIKAMEVELELKVISNRERLRRLEDRNTPEINEALPGYSKYSQR